MVAPKELDWRSEPTFQPGGEVFEPAAQVGGPEMAHFEMDAGVRWRDVPSAVLCREDGGWYWSRV
jgi:hypothetical protein